MSERRLSKEFIRILSAISERGGTDCTGSCHHRKPGEFHCHTLGRQLNLSSQGIKNRILELLRMGLLQRERIDREGAGLLIRFTITPEGQKDLNFYLQTSEMTVTNEDV